MPQAAGAGRDWAGVEHVPVDHVQQPLSPRLPRIATRGRVVGTPRPQTLRQTGVTPLYLYRVQQPLSPRLSRTATRSRVVGAPGPQTLRQTGVTPLYLYRVQQPLSLHACHALLLAAVWWGRPDPRRSVKREWPPPSSGSDNPPLPLPSITASASTPAMDCYYGYLFCLLSDVGEDFPINKIHIM